jgi:hypothetical protein
MFDDRDLFLLVRRTSSKLWRMRCRFGGKEKLLSIGPYPEATLSQARQTHDRALQQLRDGINPSAEKLGRKAQAIADALVSFEKVALARHAVMASELMSFEEYSARLLTGRTQPR